MGVFVAYFGLAWVMESSLYEEYSKLLQEQGVKFQSFDLESITEKDVLLIIDCQNDFFPEGTVEDGGRFGVDVRSSPWLPNL